MNNFYQLRKATNNIQPSKGCIPFVGLYINDLVYNNERVGKINDRLINFGKFRTSVAIVKSLSQCIEWAKIIDSMFNWSYYPNVFIFHL